MSKRALVSNVFHQRKRHCASTSNGSGSNSSDAGSSSSSSGDGASTESSFTDTSEALRFFQSHFPLEKFQGRIPAIILKHQLYSVVPNRTHVDRQLGEMKIKGDVRLFRLGIEPDDLCVMFTVDYTRHVKIRTAGTPTIDKFLKAVIPNCTDVSVNRETLLKRYGFSEQEISDLIRAGVLTIRDVGSWWLAIPGAGEFMKTFIQGRKALLFMIRRAKYSEVLQKELESRKLPKMAKLGMHFHIYDVVGADLVECLKSTSGMLLRLKP